MATYKDSERPHIYSSVGCMADIIIAILKNLPNLQEFSKKEIEDWANYEIEQLERIKEYDEMNIRSR
jgi:hypothetical protein